MAKFGKIERAFLYILQEDSDREDVNKKIQCFNDSDWQNLYELTIKTGLFPVFYSRLSSLKLENIPSEFLSRLKNLYILNLKINVLLDQESLKIQKYFKGLNIPVIPLKGPTLARYLYGDLALRQASCDLDLLVRQENIEDVGCALKNIGYDSCSEDKDAFVHSLKLKYARQLHFNKTINGLDGIMLDLHWDIRGFFVDTHLEDFWQNAREIHLDGYRVLAPQDTDLLFYLSLTSLSTFEFIELRYLYDIHRLISQFRKDLDWQQMLQKIETNGLKSYLFFALKLSQDFFHTDIPEYILNRLKPNFIKETLLKIWINRKNILWRRPDIASTYLWRYPVTSYLASRNFTCFLKKIYKKIFLPMNEVMGFYQQPQDRKSYFLYIKRLLKPLSHFFKRGEANARDKSFEKEPRYCYAQN